MIFDRNRPIQQRLTLAFGLFSSLLLLVIWLLSIAYMFIQERQELLQTVRTQAAMLATQSSAAIMFGDRTVLEENLAALRHMKNLKWAVVIASPASAAPTAQTLLAQYGTPPTALAPLMDELQGHQGLLAGLYESIVMQQVTHNEVARGHVVIAIDHGDDMAAYLTLVLVSLLLNLVFLAAILIVFRRIVASIVRPVHELAAIADMTDRSGIPQHRADSRYNDEVGKLSRSFNRMLDSLAAREQELAHSRDDLRALSQRLLAIREEERTRIAHEIHDELGQRLTALKFTLARPASTETLREAAQMIDTTIATVRNISWELRPSLLDSLGLNAAIEWLAQDFQQRIGIRCGVHLPAKTPALVPAQATDVFRICQELLTNVARHAQASRADISLEASPQMLRIEIRDNGSGIQARTGQQRSLGLLGIEERAKRWLGRVVIATRPEIEGTAIRAELPIFPSHPTTETHP